MARPRKTSGTSFGKRSDAEKTFRTRKKEKPEGRGEGRPSFSKRSDSPERGSRFSRSEKPAFGKREGGDRPQKFEKRFGGDDSKPFKRKSFDSGDKPKFERKSSSGFSKSPGSFGKKKFDRPDNRGGFDKPRGDRFEKKSFGDSERGDKPEFRKRSSPFNRGGFDKPRSDRFEKKRFGDSESGDKPEFKKRSSSFSRGGFDKPKGDRFEKKRFGNSESGEKPEFKKRNSSFERGGFDKPRDDKFEKKNFDDSEKGDKPPFEKRTGRFDSRSAGPARFSKKPFDRKPREEGEKAVGKSSNYGLPYKRKPFNKERDIKSSKRSTEEKPKTDSDLIRLNKFMANSGVGSRREADELIKLGLVTVNGEVVTEMGHKVKRTDEVRYEGKKLKAEKPVYILLNKPKGFITTTDDPQERKTVMSIVANAGPERIYPVGRLDRNTTGLLLLTNDGDLADKLTHPSFNVKKIYRVELDKPITKNDFEKVKEGVYLEEGRAIVDDVAIVDGDNQIIGIELHIGWNRIVRRIFESLGYEVEKLDRVVYAGLDKKDLNRGEWRFLKPEEIIKLKHFK
jgi:23S rRNA pseudouridine2605 synthase